VNEHGRRLSRYGWRLADPPERPVLFVNPASGGGKAARAAVADRARERGIGVTVLRPDRSLESLVGEAVEGGADALGIAGGDGSLAIVAAAAHAHGLPFVCIPAERGTTSRSTSASTGTISSARSRRSSTASSA
jgi:diacylglycerol kinase-like protein